MDNEWKKIKEKRSGTGYKKLILKTFVAPTGKKKQYDIQAENNVATILALTKQNKVILAKQFRPGPELMLFELPGGYIDKYESPETAAARELVEETGYKGKMHFVGTSYHSGYSTRVRYNFVATNCEQVQEQSKEDKDMAEVVLMPLDDFREHLQSGELSDVETGYLGLDYLDML